MTDATDWETAGLVRALDAADPLTVLLCGEPVTFHRYVSMTGDHCYGAAYVVRNEEHENGAFEPGELLSEVRSDLTGVR